jgi:hypothetical protein
MLSEGRVAERIDNDDNGAITARAVPVSVGGNAWFAFVHAGRSCWSWSEVDQDAERHAELVTPRPARPARVGIPACASISRFTAINPRRFSARANRSVSNQCRVEVSAAPRSQRFGDPMRRKRRWETLAPPRPELLLAEGHLTRRLFGEMLQRIWALPVPAG